jgi:hypothetical protein
LGGPSAETATLSSDELLASLSSRRRVDDALPAAAGLGVNRHFVARKVDPQAAIADNHLNALADQLPRHTVTVAVDIDATVALHPAHQLALPPEWRSPVDHGQCCRSFAHPVRFSCQSDATAWHCCQSPVASKRLKAHRARCRLVVIHKRASIVVARQSGWERVLTLIVAPHIVEQHLLGHAAKCWDAASRPSNHADRRSCRNGLTNSCRE